MEHITFSWEISVLKKDCSLTVLVTQNRNINWVWMMDRIGCKKYMVLFYFKILQRHLEGLKKITKESVRQTREFNPIERETGSSFPFCAWQVISFKQRKGRQVMQTYHLGCWHFITALYTKGACSSTKLW